MYTSLPIIFGISAQGFFLSLFLCLFKFLLYEMLLLHIFSRQAFIYDIGRAKTGMERGSLKERVFLNLASLAVYLIFILCYFYNVFIFPKSIRT